jgi:hypothetical protein
MARKPAPLENNAPNPQGRERAWSAIRALGEFTIGELEERSRLNMSTLRNYVLALERAHYLEKIRNERPVYLLSGITSGAFPRVRWRLVRDVGVEAPRVRQDGSDCPVGRKREQMWRTMRILREFDYRDLAINASTDAALVHERDAKHYIRYLARADYLIRVKPGKPGNKPGAGILARYRLLPMRYTGPRAPMIQRARVVYDPNLGVTVDSNTWKNK